MKVVINGSEADYPYIFVNGVKMPATFIARPANPRVDMGRRIIIEPALPEGGNTLLTADYLDFEINEVVISDNPSAYTPADVLRFLNEGHESPTDDDFPGIGSGLYSGGGGSPEIPDGSITTKKLADNCVTNAKIGPLSVGWANLQNHCINSLKIDAKAIIAENLADDCVTTDKLGDNAVTSAKIKPSAVGTSQLADDAVTTAKIANGSIIQNHLQIDSVGYPQIIDGSIDSTKVKDASIPGGKLMEQTLTTRELQPRSVTTDILADNSVTTNKIVDGAVTEAKLAPSSVATEKLQDLCVTTPKIADQAVDTTKLNTGGSPGGPVE